MPQLKAAQSGFDNLPGIGRNWPSIANRSHASNPSRPLKTSNNNRLPLALELVTLGLLLFSIQPMTAAAWVTNNPMTIARQIHTATLLLSVERGALRPGHREVDGY